MKLTSRIAAVAVFILGVAASVMAEPALAMGSPAPALTYSKWVKGKAFKNFEKGKVYVVEFWATWCGPCKTSIPHLTELAKKYKGKVTFTGVSVFEKNQEKGQFATYADKVASFVKDEGDKMNYNVCWDGDEGNMGKNWMEAAGQNGIPTAFVINQDGMIAWIGHPMANMEDVLDKVLAGTYDLKAEADRQAKAREAQDKMTAKFKTVMALFSAQKFQEAVAEMDTDFAADPMMERAMCFTKFQALMKYDAPKGNAYAKTLATGLFASLPQMLNGLAWMMVDDKHPLAGADVKVATEIAEMAVKATKAGDPTEAYNLDTLAFCYFKDGQLDKAISLQEKALKSADATKGFDAATRKEIADRLDMLKQKKG